MTNSTYEPEKTEKAAHSQDQGSLGMDPQFSQSAQEEISALFETAAIKLDRIEERAKGEKIKIVQDLARDLEGKIPIDIIAMEITHQLHGRVSERLVYYCLEVKYKQKYRSDNAKMQKRKNSAENNGLAAILPLEHREKGEIIVDTASNEVPPTASSHTNYNDMDYCSSQDEEGEQLRKCRECVELLEKCKQLTIKLNAYEEVIKSHPSMTTAEQMANNSTEYVEFEFSVPFEPLRIHMISTYKSNGGVERI